MIINENSISQENFNPEDLAQVTEIQSQKKSISLNYLPQIKDELNNFNAGYIENIKNTLTSLNEIDNANFDTPETKKQVKQIIINHLLIYGGIPLVVLLTGTGFLINSLVRRKIK